MSQKLNIVLELDEKDEWTFSIISNMELLLPNDSKLLSVKSKTVDDTLRKCKKCMEEVEISIFRREKSFNSLPSLEHVFLEEKPPVAPIDVPTPIVSEIKDKEKDEKVETHFETFK